MTYRWASAHDWLQAHIHNFFRTNRNDKLREIAQQLANQLDADEIQDLFQNEMDADGYFEQLAQAKEVTEGVAEIMADADLDEIDGADEIDWDDDEDEEDFDL